MSIGTALLTGTLVVLPALAASAVLLLALFHVRYRLDWSGTWGGLSSRQSGSVRVEFGFPGFMRAWDREHGAAAKGTEPESTPEGSAHVFHNVPRNPRPAHGTLNATPHALAPSRDPGRYRKALFRLATDAPAWGVLMRYAFRTIMRFHKLLGPRLEIALGHPDPAFLGRLAGHWYAVSPLLPVGNTVMGFRFQDRAPTVHVRAEGGFSGLALLGFFAFTLLTFPFFGLGLRAWYGWRHRGLTGWRAWAYRRIQTI